MLYIPRVHYHHPLPLWEILQNQQIGLTQAPFITAFALHPRACKILCVPFENGFSRILMCCNGDRGGWG